MNFIKKLIRNRQYKSTKRFLKKCCKEELRLHIKLMSGVITNNP